MQNFQDTFETRKRSFISAFSICMTVPLNYFKYESSWKLANHNGKIKNKSGFFIFA